MDIGLSFDWPRAGRFAHLPLTMVVWAIVLNCAVPARAGTAEEAKALTERAVAHIAAVGREQAFADFTRPDGGYVQGELFVFCMDAEGVYLAHGGNPKLLGVSLANVRDPDGRLPAAEAVTLGLTKGAGWLEDYRWPNPVTKRIGVKSAYVMKVDDQTVCGSGYYKVNAP